MAGNNAVLDVSICIPTYNGQKYLGLAVESCLNQNFRGSWEILIVDDQSRDDTLKIVKDYAEKNPSFIRILRNRENKGLVENWNTCIREAKGRWIKFLFQDDLLRSDCLQEMVSFGEKYQLKLVLCDRKYICEKGTFLLQRIFPKRYWEKIFTIRIKKLSHYFNKQVIISAEELSGLCFSNFLKDNFLGEPIAGLFKKDLTKKLGFFNHDLKQISDFEYWLRIGLNEGLGYMPEKLVSFRMHREATSRKNAKIPIAFHDEIVLGWLLLESKYYEVFRKNMCRDKKLVQIRQRYKTFLKKYIRLLGYFSLLEIMPGYGFSNYLEGFKPGFIDHLRYRFRRPKNS